MKAGNSKIGNNVALDDAGQQANQQAADNRKDRRQDHLARKIFEPDKELQICHNHRNKTGQLAHRQVDAPGNDHQHHADGQEGSDTHLAEQIGDVLRIQVTAAGRKVERSPR